jgi:hypothetical protein
MLESPVLNGLDLRFCDSRDPSPYFSEGEEVMFEGVLEVRRGHMLPNDKDLSLHPVRANPVVLAGGQSQGPGHRPA